MSAIDPPTEKSERDICNVTQNKEIRTNAEMTDMKLLTHVLLSVEDCDVTYLLALGTFEGSIILFLSVSRHEISPCYLNESQR